MLVAKATGVASFGFVALLTHYNNPPTPLISTMTGTADTVEASNK